LGEEPAMAATWWKPSRARRRRSKFVTISGISNFPLLLNILLIYLVISSNRDKSRNRKHFIKNFL